MGSLENFHQETIRRLQSGELQLGVSKMAGADRRSVAFSKLFTLFPFFAAASYCASSWGTWTTRGGGSSSVRLSHSMSAY